MLAVYNTFGQVMWTFLVLFAWILFFWLLFAVFGDLFRRHDLSGWGKAAWSIFVIFVPFLGCFVYLITQGHNPGSPGSTGTAGQPHQVRRRLGLG